MLKLLIFCQAEHCFALLSRSFKFGQKLIIRHIDNISWRFFICRFLRHLIAKNGWKYLTYEISIIFFKLFFTFHIIIGVGLVFIHIAQYYSVFSFYALFCILQVTFFDISSASKYIWGLCAQISPWHCVHNNLIYWKLLIWHIFHINNLKMLMRLAGSCFLPRIEKHKAGIHGFHSDQNGFKIALVDQISLFLLSFGYNQNMIFPHWILIQQ